jgi:hypothetical protein
VKRGRDGKIAGEFGRIVGQKSATTAARSSTNNWSATPRASLGSAYLRPDSAAADRPWLIRPE